MLWLSTILFFILRLPSLFEPYWYGDEGVYLVLGQAIRHGLVLYSQIHDNKPPAIYFLAAATQTVFGFRLLLLLWMIPTCYYFYKLALRYLSIKSSQIALLIFVVLTSIPVIEGHIANAEIFMLLPTILGFLLFDKHLFWSGLCLGIAFLFKVPVAIEFFFLLCFAFVVLKKYKNILSLFVFGIAFILPTIITGIYYQINGALMPYLAAALFQNLGYLSSWSTGTQQSSPTSSGLPLRIFMMILSWLFFYFQLKKKYISEHLFFISSWFTACLFGVLLSTRPYPHYLIQIVPPLILIILADKKYWFNKIILVGILIYSLLHYKFYFYATFSYYKNFILYSINKESTLQYRQYFGQNVNYFYQISDYIDQKSHPEDKIFIWSDDPYIYPLSNRLPSTKYVTAYHILDFNGYDQTINQLKKNLPKIIIYNQSMNRPFSNLDQFINKYYFLDEQIGPYYLFFKLR
ncbi:MAG: hypothetical protein WC069_04330 [Candidatus Shapirobacteria bacterium]